MAFGKDILNKIADFKSEIGDNTRSLKKKGVVTATFIGAGVGLAIGYSRKLNLFASVAVGAIVFGVTANLFIKK